MTSDRGGPRILIIDDSSDDRTLVRREMEREFEAPVLAEVDSSTGLDDVLSGEAFDAVIADYHLGWGNGLEIVRRVRETWPHAAAVVFTGTGTEEVAVQAMKDGVDDYVVKAPKHYRRLPLAVKRALERHRQRQALSHVEAEMRSLLDRLPAGIYRTAVEGGLLYGNPALLRTLGATESTPLLGTDMADLYVVPEERVEWLLRLENEPAVLGEFEVRRPDGVRLWIRDRARLVRGSDGEPRFVEGVIEDVTERHLAQAEVERQARAMALLQSITAIANETDDFDEALRAALARLCAWTGWPVGHVYAVSEDGASLEPTLIWAKEGASDLGAFEEATADDSMPSGRGLAGRVHRSGRPEWVKDVSVGGGSRRSRAAAAAGIRAAVAAPVVVASETVAVLELFHTETKEVDEALVETLRQTGVQLGRVAERARAAEQRRRIEAKARQAHKMEAVGRLASGIAHDFNNLITVLLMESRSALDVAGLPPPVRQALDAISATSARAALLTRQLLSFSKARPQTRSTFAAREVIEDLQPMLERILGERYELRTRIADGSALVYMDRVELDQVLLNVVVNARDAMPDGGVILLEIERREVPRERNGATVLEDRVLVHVTDTGVGIPPEIQDRIFEPFFTTKGDEGTGLGLAICYGIVSTAGGDLRVYSEPGLGTTVSIVLPLAEAGSAPESRHPERLEVPTGTETVLLVEDDEAVRRVTARALQAQGYTTMEVGDAEAALELIVDPYRSGSIDLVISDVVLPGMSGPELVDRIARSRPDLPALLTSGYSEEMIRVRTAGTSRLRIVQKPFSVAALAREVRALLDGPGSGEEGPPRAEGGRS